MNQHRWTCLTSVLLTTVLAPIATVHAKTLPSPVVNSTNNDSPLWPQSLPTITPLTVTELKTEVAVPTISRAVPVVSKLPIVRPSALTKYTVAESVKNPRGKFAHSSIPTQAPRPQLGSAIPGFHPNLQVKNPILAIANPVESVVTEIATAPKIDPRISTPVAKPQAFQPFTTRTSAKPISVVRNNGTQSATIVNSTIAQAEVDSASVPTPIVARSPGYVAPPAVTPIVRFPQQVATNSDRSQVAHLPQPTPIVAQLQDRAELPSFEAGLPVFVFDSERPQQIVATTIAQIGDQTVAPEPSIAIPVQRPKQSIAPIQLPKPNSSISQPLGTTETVKTDLPDATIKPALDKIVATQTGQASWYGSEGGSRTANGERYNPYGLTAAHRTLPFGTMVRVTSMKTGKTTIVRINDRGPFHSRRIIDVSAGAASAIGIKNDGVGEVKIEILANNG